ncbi:uncharacterized protein METZ01_LOCUS170222, partial [marine metagenome]
RLAMLQPGMETSHLSSRLPSGIARQIVKFISIPMLLVESDSMRIITPKHVLNVFSPVDYYHPIYHWKKAYNMKVLWLLGN